jgi:hypothetical protein
MSRALLVTLCSSLALSALLIMFTPFLRDFTTWHIGGEWLAAGAFLLGLVCCLSIFSARRAMLSLLAMIVIASFVEGFVIALPALRDLVPNPVSYINQAQQQLLLGCLAGGPFAIAGGVLGVALNHLLLRGRGSWADDE